MRRRRRPNPKPDRALNLVPVTLDCPECQQRTQARYNNFRTITTLDGVLHLTLSIRRCHNPDCPRFLRPYRPEAEPHFALPYHEFGLDVMALVGQLRHAEHRSIPEIHQELTGRGLVVAQRTVTNLLDRYNELGHWPRPTPAAGTIRTSGTSSWPSMDCNPMSATKFSGSCGSALRGDPLGQKPPVVDRHGPGRPDHRSASGPARADHRRGLRRPRADPQGGQEGV